MFSLEFPEIVRALAETGPGLWPLRPGGGVLALKGTAELALAAKCIKSIKFHLYRLSVGDATASGIITAIYDRPNAPMSIKTVCPEPVFRNAIREMLSRERLGIYFFDANNSELFGGEWKLRALDRVESVFEGCTEELTSSTLPDFYIQLRSRFSNPSDDGIVIEAELETASRPEGVVVIHATEECVQSLGPEGLGIYRSDLTVEEKPGCLHEAEIARLLARIYPAESVFVSPTLDSGREFCDVALGKHDAIVVQAKSTIRTEERILNEADRTKSRLNKHFRKALAQARGAERTFYRLRKRIHFDLHPLPLAPETRLLIHLIIIYEKDPALLGEWSKLVAKMASDLVPVVVLDTREFISMVNVYRTREEFDRALWTLATSFNEPGSIGEYDFCHEKIASFSGG